LIAEPIWTDPLAVVLPVRHPLAAYKRVTLADALQHPLVLCHPQAGSGCHQQIDTLLRSVDAQPTVADHAATLGVMMTLVGAGYGIGFAVAAQTGNLHRPDVVIKPLSGRGLRLTTYLLRPADESSEPLMRFVERARLANTLVRDPVERAEKPSEKAPV